MLVSMVFVFGTIAEFALVLTLTRRLSYSENAVYDSFDNNGKCSLKESSIRLKLNRGPKVEVRAIRLLYFEREMGIIPVSENLVKL